MQKDGKVLPLRSVAIQASHPPLARLPVALLHVRDKAALHLRQSLQVLFDNADDTLFEMADKAASDKEQNLLFEAMRDLRHKRKSIERGFLDSFYAAFMEVGHGDPLAALPARTPAHDTLSLVASDELERTVAVDGMVARVLARDGFALGQLTLRFNSLVQQRLNDQNNPLGPALLCEYFLRAGRSLGVGIKVKLVLLKLFERYVLREADQLYGEANQLLIATGILPELKVVPRRRAQDRAVLEIRAPANEADAEAEVEALDANTQAVFSSLQSLLRPVRGRLNPRLGGGPARPVSGRDLLRLLTHLQQYVPVELEHEDFDLRHHLEQLLTRLSVQSGSDRRLEACDEDVINLIAMLFDFILGDRNLPHSLRVLIGRLQIPLLKVALLDKRFFSRATHPARRLLNELAAAAMGWDRRDDQQRDHLYQHVDMLVQRLLDDFSDDPAIFGELLNDFLAFNNDERRRAELLEQRTRDAEEGRALTEHARGRVQHELNCRLQGRQLPRIVVRVLEDAWSQVLLLAWLKHGEHSAPWHDALATMDALLWSVGPLEQPDDRQLLLERVPGLLKALREGLGGAVFDPFATSEFFAALEALHVGAFAPAGEGGEGQPGTERVLVRDEIVLRGPEDWPLCDSDECLAEDDPQLLRVRQLQPGTWIELHDHDEPLRCKLIALFDDSDRYVFVNRSGMKVREWSATGLALALQRGDVSLLDDSLLFDRALDSVVSQLKGDRH
ncbi:DUF1631 domain-containing protein [Pseudomonas sp. zfem002]|uniref:DUF1631 domain-containing protein n=1 Tax=Pseudomonas sp. zfem002 TaxID=3078197 RepID=UPI002929A42D|nr:DUF1631 domain-containing protein [Pseudomonas sp. zfem002]MDU9389882.1 DUF1631 domain-containing protein [Pseudomonas sp. zfem002]